MDLFAEVRVATLVATVVYSLLGVSTFGLALFLMVKMAPFSIRKEIEEDQNVALGVIIGSAFIGLAIIVGAVMGS